MFPFWVKKAYREFEKSKVRKSPFKLERTDRSSKAFNAVFNNQIFFNFGSNFPTLFFPILLRTFQLNSFQFFVLKNTLISYCFQLLSARKIVYKKITTSPVNLAVILLPIMTLVLNPRQNQIMTVVLILNKSFNSIGE